MLRRSSGVETVVPERRYGSTTHVSVGGSLYKWGQHKDRKSRDGLTAAGERDSRYRPKYLRKDLAGVC